MSRNDERNASSGYHVERQKMPDLAYDPLFRKRVVAGVSVEALGWSTASVSIKRNVRAWHCRLLHVVARPDMVASSGGGRDQPGAGKITGRACRGTISVLTITEFFVKRQIRG